MMKAFITALTISLAACSVYAKAVQKGYEAWLRGRNVEASKENFCGNKNFMI
jgi:hypothetical protein